PWDPTATVYNPITKKNQLALFTVDWDNGFFGFVPTGAKYNGDGSWSWVVPKKGRPTLKARGLGLNGEEVDGNLSPIKLTLFFSGIFTDTNKKNQASAIALPGLLDCLGLFQGQIQQLHNDNGVFSALAAAPNREAAEAAQKVVQDFLSQQTNDPSMIQIVAHSNGNPTAKYFLDLMTRRDPSFRVGSTVLIAPNVDSTSIVESIFSRSDSNILMQSNRDFALRLGRILTGASQRIGAFQRDVKSPSDIIQTKQRGHGIQSYRKAYCGY
ncbi:MAG: alpha/beta hydrolase, partial [Acidobacteria bacterium]|nr:alpha/beta hydrolase [Acidobacteriota bacterium]